MSRGSDFGTFGRYTELQLDEMTADQRKAYEFTVGQRGEVPGPYKIWLQNPRLIEVMVQLGAYYQGHSSLSEAEIEIATNLTNARWLASYSNYEHEIIGARDGGLPPEKVEALIATRVVPTRLYRRAVNLLGHAGLNDLTVLTGYFTCVSLSLRAYDVPSNAVGLER
jgi:4-carboxymuconolactone decarboxylase